MTKNNKTPEHHTAAGHDKDLWSLPKEEAIAQLMCEFDMTREEAEAVLERQSTPRTWRDAVELVTPEEMRSLLEEIARSGQNMSIGLDFIHLVDNDWIGSIISITHHMPFLFWASCYEICAER